MPTEEIRQKVVAHLQTDALLYGGDDRLASGGIWDRPLRRGKEPGATPEAFRPLTGDAAQVPRLRPALVVESPNEVSPADGPVSTGDAYVLRVCFFRIFIYAPATSAGKMTIDAINTRLVQDLSGWQTVLSTGKVATFQVLERSPAIDSEEFEGSLVATRRISAEYLRLA